MQSQKLFISQSIWEIKQSICSMKNVLFVAILIIISCLPSFGQMRVFDNNGKEYYAYGGIGNLAEELFLYRDIYGQYPNDKNILLDFVLSKDRFDSKDSLMFLDQISITRKRLTRLLKNRKNRLTVSHDTCSFFIAKTRTTIQCYGGVAELQKSDSYLFRRWTYSRFFDKNGCCLWSFSSESPFMPQEINKRFNLILTTESRSLDEHDLFVNKRVPTPVLIPITMTRNGAFSYDVSCLKGLQLYYQEFGEPFDPANTIGPISIEEAFDSDYLDVMKAYLKAFIDKHDEIGSIRLWELVLFNNPSNTTISQQQKISTP